MSKKRPKATPKKIFIENHLKEQSKTSEGYRERFEKTRDPGVVVEFIRETPFALKEEWVVDVIISWLHMGKFELIKRAFLPHKGERSNEYVKEAINFFLCERIDRLVAQGMTKTEAFETVDLHFGKVLVQLDPGTIRNRYYATKKEPKMYIQL